MLHYILKRLLLLIPILLGVSIIVFTVLHMSPGDPAQIMLGPMASQESIAQMRESLGLNKPLYIQYFIFLKNTLQGDFGRSIRTNTPVIEEIFSRLPATLKLSTLGMLLAIIIGFPLGVLAALKQNTIIDTTSSFLALIGFSIPWVIHEFQDQYRVR
ncbi:unnamed protein product, partial [marine sediment metagenome]